MRKINCYIPIKLCITGRPSDVQLEELCQSLARALATRIAFAERTAKGSRAVSKAEIIEPAHERADVTRFVGGAYDVPAYDQGSRRQRIRIQQAADSLLESSASAETQSRLPLTSDFHNYAFFFTGGNYGRAAEAYVAEFFPEHHRFQARSFEQMFHLLAQDIRHRRHRSWRPVYVSEIIIVTHANAAGGLKIPLTQDNRRRTFTPWDLAELQREFVRDLHRRFHAERREVAAALNEHTRVVVRGCNFGQSQDALDALRAFFGGEPLIFAPTGFQGFEVLRVGSSFLRTPEQAFDFLVQQGYLPADQSELPLEEKRRYIRKVFGERAGIPAEFFIMSESDYASFKQLGRNQRVGIEAERFIRRPFQAGESEEAANVPSGSRFWNFSAPPASGRDPELDPLSIEEIIARARHLNNPYRPENAAMLLRLSAAWFRKGESFPQVREDGPLAGLPPIDVFGDSKILAEDATRYPEPSKRHDMFEEETLTYQAPATPVQREEAMQFQEVEQVFEEVAGTGLLGPLEGTVSTTGRVEMLPDGVRLWDFAVNSAKLRRAYHSALRRMGGQALGDPTMKIIVEGHTSSSGSDGTNERISDERAQAVQQFLIGLGIPANRIDAQGFGERRLLVAERRGAIPIRENMAKNRRVDVRFAGRTTAAAQPQLAEAELEDVIRRLGPPPASRPEWIMWVFNVLTAAGHGKKVSWILGRLTQIDIQARLDVASFVQLAAWTIFAPLANIAEGQALGRANGAKRGFAEALNTMAQSVHDPPDGRIYYPSDEVPLDLVNWPYSQGLQDGYRHGVQTAVQTILGLQAASPHGGEIFLLALRYLYYEYPEGIAPRIVEMLDGYQRRFRTPTPVDPLLRLLGEDVEK